MTLKFFNTLDRKVQEFRPLVAGQAGMYACGPTVYNYAHIGNLRTYLFEDTLRRTLKVSGYRLKHVMNITDVGHLTDDADQGEDKILKSARESGRTVWEIAELYTRAFFADLEALHIETPEIVCRATDHIPDMIELIRRLESRGYTYRAGGNLYFDIGKLPDYGKLARLNLEELRAGARIDVDENKKNPLDFALWFTRSKFEHQTMLWDSPWGRGYPGWHIECSAMSSKYLGEHFDIHCGGVDHIPVHHTNEIAQSEAAFGGRWVSYWLHGEFLVLARQKMAKSGGGFITLASLAERGYHPLDYRYFCLGAHYRSQLRFSFPALEAAKAARRNLQERIAALKDELKELQGPRAGEMTEGLPAGRARSYLEAFAEDICQDLNTPRCLADLWGLVKEEAVEPPHKARALLAMDRVLGLDLAHCETEEPALEEGVRRLIQERAAARESKNYARADEIRELLSQKGIRLEDTPMGVVWKKK